MRFLAIVCLIGILLSVAIISETHVVSYTNTCISSNAPPTVVGTPFVPSVAQPSVVLNEVLPNPISIWNCASQNGPDNVWIELYNLLDQPLDLYGARTCVDTGPNTSPYCLTIGSIIPAHGFLTFFPNAASHNASPLKFPLTLRLLMAYAPVDQVNVPSLPGDVSYASIPDGTGKWQQDPSPTINSTNSIITSPTPTHSHKKLSISKATTQGRKKHTKSIGAGNSNTTSQASVNTPLDKNQQMQNDVGKQTRWPGLQFPSSLASPSALSAPENIRSAPSSPPAENVPQKMLFSLIGIAGLLSIWLGWRRFFKKKDKKAKNTFAPR